LFRRLSVFEHIDYLPREISIFEKRLAATLNLAGG
jgi:hypothetical protein